MQVVGFYKIQVQRGRVIPFTTCASALTSNVTTLTRWYHACLHQEIGPSHNQSLKSIEMWSG